jgi:hypothetical protein
LGSADHDPLLIALCVWLGAQICIAGDSISAKELNNVLGSLSDKVDLVGADACLMGMTEFAYEIRHNASVFVGSQELEPGMGWNYTTGLRSLVGNPTMTATQLGATIVSRYGQHYGVVSTGVEETLSAINLAALRESTPGNLTTALSGFAATVMTTASSYDLSVLDWYRDYRAGSFGGEDPAYHNYCDIGNLFYDIASSWDLSSGIRYAAQTVLNAFSSTVINNYSSVPGRGNGLSIYMFDRGVFPTSSYNSSNLSFVANTQWDDLLNWLWW